MVLTFRSTIPESFTVTGVDPDGRKRVATASRTPGDFNWNMRLEHPSGRNWQATFRGHNVLDALGELMTSKDIEFKQDKGRGDKPHDKPYDSNRRVAEAVSPVVSQYQRR